MPRIRRFYTAAQWLFIGLTLTASVVDSALTEVPSYVRESSELASVSSAHSAVFEDVSQPVAVVTSAPYTSVTVPPSSLATSEEETTTQTTVALTSPTSEISSTSSAVTYEESPSTPATTTSMSHSSKLSSTSNLTAYDESTHAQTTSVSASHTSRMTSMSSSSAYGETHHDTSSAKATSVPSTSTTGALPAYTIESCRSNSLIGKWPQNNCLSDLPEINDPAIEKGTEGYVYCQHLCTPDYDYKKIYNHLYSHCGNSLERMMEALATGCGCTHPMLANKCTFPSSSTMFEYSIQSNSSSRASEYTSSKSQAPSATSTPPPLPSVCTVKMCPNDGTKVWKENCLGKFEKTKSGSAKVACDLLCKPDYTKWSDNDYDIYDDLVETCKGHNWAVLALMDSCGCITPNTIDTCELPRKPLSRPTLSSGSATKTSTTNTHETFPSVEPRPSGAAVIRCPNEYIDKNDWPSGNCLTKVFSGVEQIQYAHTICNQQCTKTSDKTWPDNLAHVYQMAFDECKSPMAIDAALRKGCGCLNEGWVGKCNIACQPPTESESSTAPAEYKVTGLPITEGPTRIYTAKLTDKTALGAQETTSSFPPYNMTGITTEHDSEYYPMPTTSGPKTSGWSYVNTYDNGASRSTFEKVTYVASHSACCTVPNSIPQCVTPPGPPQFGYHDPACNQWYYVRPGDTCQKIAEIIKNGASAQDIMQWNEAAQPDCRLLWSDRWLCVSVLTRTNPVGGQYYHTPTALYGYNYEPASYTGKTVTCGPNDGCYAYDATSAAEYPSSMTSPDGMYHTGKTLVNDAVGNENPYETGYMPTSYMPEPTADEGYATEDSLTGIEPSILATHLTRTSVLSVTLKSSPPYYGMETATPSTETINGYATEHSAVPEDEYSSGNPEQDPEEPGTEEYPSWSGRYPNTSGMPNATNHGD